MKKQIPVQNIYRMLCYAWGFAHYGEHTAAGSEDLDAPADLYAKLFEISLEGVFKRGLSRGYIERIEETRTPRDKIRIGESLKSLRLKQGIVTVETDELSTDCLLNQIVKAGLKLLLMDRGIADSSRHLVRGLLNRFSQVSDIKLSPQHFSRVRIGSSTKHYIVPIGLVELLYQSLLFSEQNGFARLRTFFDDTERMAALFEAFIRGFYEVEQKIFIVRAEKLKWDVTDFDQNFSSRVPELQTDVTLIGNDRVIVIDAKFYTEALQSKMGGRAKYRRSHLSQLLDYLRRSESKHQQPTDGVLIYPVVSYDLNDAGKIDGFPIRVFTIDLAKDWVDLRIRLQSLLSLPPAGY